MVEMNSTQATSQHARPGSLSRLATSCAGLCLVGLLGVYLWSEFAQTVQGMIDGGESTVAVVSNGLPVDAPAVSVARVKEQEAAAQDAAAAASVLVFKDWNYTQSSTSPFSFSNSGLDFFNPLFAFDFGSSQGNSLSSLFGNNGSTTPFGLSSNSSTTPTTTTTSSNGTTTTTFTAPLTSNGTGSGGTVSIPFLNGTTLNLTISINFGPQPLGAEGFSHRHFNFSGSTITITIQIVSPTA